MSTPKTEAAAQWMKDVADELAGSHSWQYIHSSIARHYAPEQARVEELRERAEDALRLLDSINREAAAEIAELLRKVLEAFK